MSIQSCNNYHKIVSTNQPVLDVRAPVEFSAGHLVQSVNLPLLDDSERHAVGTTYKQSGQSAAIELGERLVNGGDRLHRISRWTQFINQHPNAVLCCARGGLRSRTVQRWLRESCELNVPVVTGGYKALRRFMLEQIQQICLTQSFVLLAGSTGSGKTLMLNQIKHAIDLEALAHHRGSAFGALPGGQPYQASFENALASALIDAQSQTPSALVLEHEGSMIGSLSLPPPLRQAMASAPLVVVEQSLTTRVDQIRYDYVDTLLEACTKAATGSVSSFEAFSEQLLTSASKIRKRLGGQRHDQFMTLVREAIEEHRTTGNTDKHTDWISYVLVEYYDPMYSHQLKQHAERICFRGSPDAVFAWFRSRFFTQ